MLYRLLRERAKVRIWSEHEPDPAFAASLPIERVGVDGSYPRGGTLVVVGPYFELGDWVRKAGARRAILVYNVFEPQFLVQRRAQLAACGADRVELVFTSHIIAGSVSLGGRVETSWIDLERFRPAAREPGRPFTVGRLSRDVVEKHHPGDPRLYRRLARDGMTVRVLGGTCLREGFGRRLPSRVELLPARQVPAEEFLRGLDCFYYRLPNECIEPGGRVVAEAMCCGLPVVATYRGGYREWIEDGVTGFLFHSGKDARRILRRLKGDPALRSRIGAAARESMEQLFNEENREALIEYYTR